MKKTKGKAKDKEAAIKVARKTSLPRTKKPVDLGEVRQEIARIVGTQATVIAQSVVDEGKKGNLEPVKYLFEMIGLYPAPDGPGMNPGEDSLVKRLLQRLELPETAIAEAVKQEESNAAAPAVEEPEPEKKVEDEMNVSEAE
jgi:hypothetical protein